MSLESDIIKTGPADPKKYAQIYKKKLLEDTAFRREQQIKKEKIGDAVAAIADMASERAESGEPMRKIDLGKIASDILAQFNFEQPDESGKMVDRPPEMQGSEFSLPEYGYFIDLIQLATEGIPIAGPGGAVTTNGVKIGTAERFRKLYEDSLKKLRGAISANPELKSVLPAYMKEQKTGMPVTLQVPKLDNFTSLSNYLNKHS